MLQMPTAAMGSDHFPILLGFNIPLEHTEFAPPKWSFKKADWSGFSAGCSLNITDALLDPGDIDGSCSRLSDTLIQVADEFIPVSASGRRRRGVPYWDNVCEDAVAERTCARRRFERTRLLEDRILYNAASASSRRTILEAKRSHWRNFCDRLDAHTPVKKVWGVIRSISGVVSKTSTPILKSKDSFVVACSHKAHLLASHFSSVSSAKNSSAFAERHAAFERDNASVLNSSSSSPAAYNQAFSLDELRQALRQCKNSSTGQDRICYEMFCHMSAPVLLVFLAFFNLIWTSGSFTLAWRGSVVVPFLKPGNVAAFASSY